MKKIILVLLLSLQIFANTGWSGRVINGQDFEAQMRLELLDHYNDICYINSKLKTNLPEIIITPADLPSFTSVLGLVSPKYRIEFDSFDLSKQEYFTQEFEVELVYNPTFDGFDMLFIDDFSLSCSK